MSDQPQKLVNILLVEDSIGDINLTQEALKECNLDIRLHTVMDGEEAIKFLNKVGMYANSPKPDLVLLDLNLPKVGGRQVLEKIKGDPNLQSIPVIVLTMSKNHEDVLRSYQLQANCYIQKPIDLDEFVTAIKTVVNFWFLTVSLPP